LFTEFNYFEIQILDKFESQADGVSPPGIALSSPCLVVVAQTQISLALKIIIFN
jgi:hypothetical protein